MDTDALANPFFVASFTGHIMIRKKLNEGYQISFDISTLPNDTLSLHTLVGTMSDPIISLEGMTYKVNTDFFDMKIMFIKRENLTVSVDIQKRPGMKSALRSVLDVFMKFDPKTYESHIADHVRFSLSFLPEKRGKVSGNTKMSSLDLLKKITEFKEGKQSVFVNAVSPRSRFMAVIIDGNVVRASFKRENEVLTGEVAVGRLFTSDEQFDALLNIFDPFEFFLEKS